MSDKIREALLALIEAVEHTPLGIRGIKAVEQGRAALAEPAAPVAKPVMPTEAELIALAERLGSVGELCRTEDHPDTIWRIRCEVEELVREVLKTYAAAPGACPGCRALSAEMTALRAGRDYCGACPDGCDRCSVRENSPGDLEDDAAALAGTSREVYLVLAEEGYESPIILRAFGDRPSAQAFAQQCLDYRSTQPAWPSVEDDDDVFAQKEAAMNAWRSAHPGGEDAGWRSAFTVLPVPAGPTWVAVADRMPGPAHVVLACYREDSGQLCQIRAEFVAPKSRIADCVCEPFDVETDEETGLAYWPAGWYERIDNWGEYRYIRVCEGEVTHWMYMPAIPIEKAKT